MLVLRVENPSTPTYEAEFSSIFMFLIIEGFIPNVKILHAHLWGLGGESPI